MKEAVEKSNQDADELDDTDNERDSEKLRIIDKGKISTVRKDNDNEMKEAVEEIN